MIPLWKLNSSFDSTRLGSDCTWVLYGFFFMCFRILFGVSVLPFLRVAVLWFSSRRNYSKLYENPKKGWTSSVLFCSRILILFARRTQQEMRPALRQRQFVLESGLCRTRHSRAMTRLELVSTLKKLECISIKRTTRTYFRSKYFINSWLILLITFCFGCSCTMWALRKWQGLIRAYYF